MSLSQTHWQLTLLCVCQTSQHLMHGAKSLQAIPGLCQAGPWPCRCGAAASSFPLGWRSRLFLCFPSGSSQLSSICSGPNFPPGEVLGIGNGEQLPFSKASSSAPAISGSVSAGGSAAGEFLALEVPQHSAPKCPYKAALPAALAGAAGDSAGAGSLQSSAHNITYVQINAPNGDNHKATALSRNLLTARRRASPKPCWTRSSSHARKALLSLSAQPAPCQRTFSIRPSLLLASPQKQHQL